MGAKRYSNNASSISYGEKTSSHGYYAPAQKGGSYAGTNSNGSRWTSTNMEWYPTQAAAPKPTAAAAPAPIAAPQAATPAFDKRIADINSSYAAETTRLTGLMAQQQKDYNTRSTNQMSMFNQRSAEQQAAFDKYSGEQDKKISNLSNSVANSASQYDPTKNMSTSNNINPALTIQEKGKDLSKGTQRYNRNSKLNITNVNV